MSLKVILFDLDGTLLPMDQNVFVKDYFGRLAKFMAPRGYEPEKLVEAVWAGTKAMIANPGDSTNEQAFWKTFCRFLGDRAAEDEPYLTEFYNTEFQKVQASCGFTPDAAQTVSRLKAAGFRLALATNPIFPSIATQSRIRWAGLNPQDFEFCTTYENSRRTKPNPDYYLDILKKLNAEACECLMAGNDVTEDMIAQTLGMQVFLVTDCLINHENRDISVYPHGSLRDLPAFLGL